MVRKEFAFFMRSVLYIASPSSIHDIKWMSYFSQQKDQYKVYLVGEGQNTKDYEGMKGKLKDYDIELLPPIHSFSISSPVQTLRSILTLRSYISLYKIDLVHILFATPHALWARFIQAPYIITTRGSDALIVIPSLLKSSGIRGVYDKILFRLFKSAFLNAKINTVTSIAQSDRLKELFGIKNIEVIRTGVDVDKIKASKNTELLNPLIKGKKFIFSPRFMMPIYNIEIQIDALDHVPQEILDAYTFIFIIGKAYDESYFRKMVQKLNDLKLKKNLSFLIEDYLEQNELWTYYNYASLTIMTPVSDGTPNSALEAMAAGCPLIMPDLPYDKELFENTCLVLKENNPEALASLITNALHSYPAGLKETAFLKASEKGNRAIEMKKLEALYH